MSDEKQHSECATCICGKRALVQANKRLAKGEGTIAWAEHLEAYASYSAQYGKHQSAERLNERGGFCYGELVDYHEPLTWQPRR